MSREEVSLLSLYKAPYDGQQWGWGFYTVWGIYGGKPPITVSASLESEGEGGSWLWMMAGTLGTLRQTGETSLGS